MTQNPADILPIAQLVPMGTSGILLALMFLTARFAGKLLNDALTAFKETGANHVAAMNASTASMVSALDSLRAAMEKFETKMTEEFRFTREDNRAVSQLTSSAPAEQLSQQITGISQQISEQRREMRMLIREIRSDLRLTPSRHDTPPDGVSMPPIPRKG